MAPAKGIMSPFENLALFRAASGFGLVASLVAITGGVACTRLETGCEAGPSCDSDTAQGGEGPSGGMASAGASPMRSGGASSGGGGRSSAGGAELGGEGGEPSQGGDHAGGASATEAADISVQGPARLRLRQSTTAEVAIRIARKGEYDGLVEVSFSNLPSGVVGSSEVLRGTETETTLRLIANEDAVTGGPFSIQLKAASLEGQLSSASSLELIVAGKSGSLDGNFHNAGVLFSSSTKPVGMGLDSTGRIYLASNFIDGSVKYGTVERSSSDGQWELAPVFEPPLSGQLGTDLTAFAMGNSEVWLGVRGYTVESAASTGLIQLGLDGRLVPAFGSSGFRSTSSDPQYIVPRPDHGAYLVTEDTASSVLADGSDADLSLDFRDCTDRLARASQGRLLLGCLAGDNTDNQIVRVLPDGSMDGSFGDGGKVLLETENYLPVLFSLLEASSGDIFGTYNELIFKLDQQGLAVADFGQNGLLDPGLGSNLDVMEIQDGLVMFRAYYRGAPLLRRIDFNGNVDSTFASGGTLDMTDYLGALDINSANVTIHSVVEDEAFGRLLIAADDGKHAFILRFWL